MIFRNPITTYDPVCVKAIEAFEAAFNAHLRKELTKGAALFDIDLNKGTFPYLEGEFAEHICFDINESSASPVEAGKNLGIAAALLYNAHVKNATMRRGHQNISQVCMKVNAIVDNGGMDYTQEGKGWIAFRLFFASM
jgi:hypothetical protein